MKKRDLECIIGLCNSERPFDYVVPACSFLWGIVPDLTPNYRLAGEIEGKLVAGAGYVMAETAPDLWRISIIVHPDYRRQGIAATLYARLLASLHPRGARRLLTSLYSTQQEGLHFVRRHGFALIGSSLHYQLDVAAATGDLDAADAIVAAQGLRFATLDRFPRQTLAGRLLPIWNSTRPDQPAYWPFRPYSARRLEREMLEPAEVALEHSLALVSSSNQVVALALSAWLDACHLGTIYLGVDPALRRCGLATALKLRLIAHARRHGIAYLIAENDAGNAAMRAINTRLGYRPLAELLVFQKLLDEEY